MAQHARGEIECRRVSVILIHSERFAEHQTPPGHPERPERSEAMDAIANRWRARGIEIVAPRAATVEQLARVHDVDYLRRIAETAGRATALDADTYTSPESCEIALLAAGAAVDAGRVAGRGFTVNVPIEVGASDEDYQTVFAHIVLPVLRQFEPDLLIVSAGFDAHERDPLGGMRLTTPAFAAMTLELRAVAEACCFGRIVAA